MVTLVGEDDGLTRLSYIEYQALLVLVALSMFAGWAIIELTMKRFHVLPIVFPGMFSVRSRRFYFFDFDIGDRVVGKRLRDDAKTILRITCCMTLAYLWQHCVLETTQLVGSMFPREQCRQGQDCFASELHIATLINRRRTPVNCSGSQEDFPTRLVVTCIRIIPPNADEWLMHLAIAHAVSQLCIRCYEVLVWSCGRSPRLRCLVAFLAWSSFATFAGLFFSGVMVEFAASWLTFVTCFLVPILLHTAWKTGREFERLMLEEASAMQSAIEEHLNKALSEFRVQASAEEEEQLQWEEEEAHASAAFRAALSVSGTLRSSISIGARRARQLLDLTPLRLRPLTTLLGRRPSTGLASHEEEVGEEDGVDEAEVLSTMSI